MPTLSLACESLAVREEEGVCLMRLLQACDNHTVSETPDLQPVPNER